MFFNKSKYSHSTKTNSCGEDLTHLTAKGELPFGWMAYNKEIIDQMEDELSFFRKGCREAKTIEQQYAALKSFAQYLKDGKVHYSRVGECEGKYFVEYICKSQEAKDKAARLKQIKEKMKSK